MTTFQKFLKGNINLAPIGVERREENNACFCTPMENPFAYIKTLQTEFDGSQIKYTEDIGDPDMNPKAQTAIPEWKVYFDGGFWRHHGRDHAGIEIPTGGQFQWAGRQWIIPAVYSCSKGLVMDFCMRIDPEEIRIFMDKWHLDIENDAHHHFSDEEIMGIERDNPLCFNFSPQIVLNGTIYHTSHGSGVSYNPCLPGNVMNEEAEWIIHHYGLDESFGWMVWRSAFPWKGKRRREIHSLSLIMEQQPVTLPGPHFTVTSPGDRFQFAHPTTGQLYTLNMQECEQKELPQSVFRQPDMEFPMYYTAMSYTITPDLPDGAITIRDCADSDQPRRKEVNPMEPEASHCTAVSMIGGSDGPTAIILCNREERKQHVVCSSPHFEPADKIEWRMIFHERQFTKMQVDLVSQG